MSPLKNEAILIAFPLLPTQISAQISLKMFRFLVSLNHIVLINVPEGGNSHRRLYFPMRPWCTLPNWFYLWHYTRFSIFKTSTAEDCRAVQFQGLNTIVVL